MSIVLARHGRIDGDVVQDGDVTSAIAVEDLVKRYRRKVAVQDVSFSVEPGQTVGFLGPNGSGKTTVLRVVAGLIAASSGRVQLLGHDVSLSTAAGRADLGYLPGTLRLPETMTGRAFLRFVSRLRGGRGSGAMEPLAERFSVPLDETIATMSKGTRQKIGVIQAFMHDPAVLLLDEPTSGLDPLVQREFDALLREHADRGAAAVLSSHVLSEVERIADHVVILNLGHLVASGPITSMSGRIHRRLRFEFSDPVASSVFSRCPGVTASEADGDSVTVTVAGPETAVLRMAAAHGAVKVVSREPSLDEMFVALTGHSNAG